MDLLRNRLAQPDSTSNPFQNLLFSSKIESISQAGIIKKANFWRDYYNPLRLLTIDRAVYMLEWGERGAYADLQWAYRSCEKREPTLRSLIERYEGGLLKLDWQIKLKPETLWPKGATKTMALAQQAALREAYDRLENIREVFKMLIQAEFRGYAHLEKIQDETGHIIRLQPVEQWYWCREGTTGQWTYNPEAYAGQRVGMTVDLDRFLIREVPRPINEIGLINFVFVNMCKKDWAAFVESYGVPSIFFIAPQGTSPTRQTEFQEIVEKVIADARGTLPFGTDIKFADVASRGNNPFKEMMDFLREEVVLAGTGGKLTMLTESGSGTLAGGAHQSGWDEIMEGKAIELSEFLQRHFDKPEVLDRLFPGQPHLAYFDLTGKQKLVMDDVVKLSSAGYQIDVEQLEEKTGYELELKQAPTQLGFGQPSENGRVAKEDGEDGEDGESEEANDAETGEDPEEQSELEATRNRGLRSFHRPLPVTAQEQYLASLAADLAPLRERLQALLAIQDEALFRRGLAQFEADIEQLKRDIIKLPSSARILAGLQVAEIANGMEAAARQRQGLRNRENNSDEEGHWVTMHGQPVLIKEGETASDAAERTFGGSKGKGRDSTEAKPSASSQLQDVKRVGKEWRMADGSPLPEHARKLKLFAGWHGVRVSTDPKSDLQAIALDEKGRSQRLYSESATMRQAAIKFERNQSLIKSEDKVVKENSANLKSSELKTAESAHMLRLIHSTGIRPGSDKETGGDVQAYGATTLEGRHVVIEKGATRLRFIGKKGVKIDLEVQDKSVAEDLRARKEQAGEKGRLFKAAYPDLLDYTHSIGGGKFKPKDFRTLKGTSEAMRAVEGVQRPKTMKEYKDLVLGVAKRVAAKLGNTPSVALKHYINPFVFADLKPA